MSGLTAKIIRRTHFGACKWCQEVAGVYDYKDVRNTGNDVFRRHSNCACVVIYDPQDGSGTVQNAHTKETFSKKEEVEKRINVQNVRKSVNNSQESNILYSGARITDLTSKEADDHAKRYYKFLETNNGSDIEKIANNTGYKKELIRIIKEYTIFNHAYVSDEEFFYDCAIAQSWQRMWLGKDIKPHDITLLEHEFYELTLKKMYPNLSHSEAHDLTELIYPYDIEVKKYYGNLKKR